MRFSTIAYFHWKGEISTPGRDEFAAHHDRKRTSRDYEIVAVFIRGAQKTGNYRVRQEKQERGKEEGVFGARSRVLMLSRESSCDKQTNSGHPPVNYASRSRGKFVNYMLSLRRGYIDPIDDLGKLHPALKRTCSWTLGLTYEFQ